MVFRPDIEGLRAVAVVLVVSAHLFEWPSGGFVGVDVFFVISGFLITSLLLRDLNNAGRIDFRNFYVRRVRRIVPVAVLVLLTTTVAAWVVFVQSRALQTTIDAAYALIFMGNWHFAATDSDYFAVNNVVSPLLPFWSLSVEEQFYLVWPTLLLVLVLTARRFGIRGLLLVSVSAMVVAFFAWAVFQSRANPVVAYYSTFTRAWELGVGAVLAMSIGLLKRMSSPYRRALGWVGLLVITLSSIFISQELPFPGPWALAPVIGTAMVISAGTGARTPKLVVIENPVATYLGRLSYSLFLWNFPVIVILAALMPVGLSYYLLCLGVTISLSVLSFHLLEDPIRRSDWLSPKAPSTDRYRRSRSAPRTFPGAAQLTIITGLALLALGVVGMNVEREVVAGAPSGASGLSGGGESAQTAKARTDLETNRDEAVRAAAAADVWPSLDMSSEATTWQGNQDSAACSRTADQTNVCVFPNDAATKSVFVIGDSVSIAWLPAIRRALEPLGWQITAINRAGCPPVPVMVRDQLGNTKSECTDFQAFVQDQVAEARPDAAIVANWFSYYDTLPDAPPFETQLATWADATQRMVEGFDKAGAKVWILGTPPGGQDLRACRTNFNTPKDCLATVSSAFEPVMEASRRGVAQAVSGGSVANFVDTLSWFCTPSLECPAFIGSYPTYADGEHLAPAQSGSLAALLAQALG